MTHARRFMLALAALAVLGLSVAGGAGSALAADKDVFTVSGIKVDVRDKDAATAKIKAIQQAQVKAFHKLLRRIASEEAWGRLKSIGPRAIGRMMSSLSVQEEHTGPRRYIGKLTIRFMPRKVRAALRKAGAGYVTRQAPRVLVVPVWKGPEGPVLFKDNPWRKAWEKLDAANALVPVLIPVGDLTDSQTISAEDALARDKVKLEALQMRYDTQGVLVAIAEPAGDNAVHASMTGSSPVGEIAFDKTYISTDGGIAAAAEQAARRFHTVMTYKWKKKIAAERAARAAKSPARASTRLTVNVPFHSLREWQSLQARIRTTPGVVGVDVSTLSGTGAIISLASSLSLPRLQAALQQSRLYLQQANGRWYLQAY